jgi:hypothetical protein
MNGKLIAAALVVVLFLLAAAPPVLADGGFFPDSMYRDLYESSQKAVILYGNYTGSYAGNCTGNCTEHLILSVSWEGDAEDFAWVVPVPNIPEITVTDPDLFWELSEYTAEEIPYRPGFGCYPSPEGEGEAGGVDVIEERVVGPYAMAILSATNATALADWLNANGYVLPAEAEEIVSEYIEKQWYFVATKINAIDEGTGEALAEGAIEPIVLSFACNETVYPLRISSLSAPDTTTPEILLYVLADHLMVPEQYPLYVGYGNWEENTFTLEFGANVSLEDLPDWLEILPELVSAYLPSDQFYLTKLRGSVSADQMVDIKLVSYEGAEPLHSLTDSSASHDEVIVLALIVGPAFGLHLWRRRRKITTD